MVLDLISGEGKGGIPMSLVSHFVIMDNGIWYKNPEIFDKTGNWYICFDDDDPPEIVVHHTDQKHLSVKEKNDTIRMVLEKHNISAKIQYLSSTGNRMYPPYYDGFKPSISAFIKIKERININNLIVKHDGEFVEVPPHDCVIYDFKRKEV